MSEADNEETKKMIEFLELVGKLKHVKRTGWVLRGLDDCETISGHMYRMAMMAFLVKDKAINRYKTLQIALIHDLAECIVGDITPFCGVSVEEKHRQEDEAMKYIAGLIGSSGPEVYTLYKEYENSSSTEAKFVKELDKFDMVFQAFEYEKKENQPMKYQEFFTNTEGCFTHPFILKLLNEVHIQRNALWK